MDRGPVWGGDSREPKEHKDGSHLVVLKPFYGLFFVSAPVKAKDAMCNPVVMSVLLSVCNKPRPLTSQAIISSGQADTKLPGDRRLVLF